MSKVLEYLYGVFNSYLTLPRIAIILSASFVIITAISLVINASFSNMAKAKRAEKKMNKFFKKNSAIDYYNAFSFKKKCISKLPWKSRKEWRRFEIDGTPIEQTPFSATLRERVGKGGAVGFTMYLYYYIAIMVVLVVAMMMSELPQSLSSIYVCLTLVLGAVGMFVLGLQLYCMDKKATLAVDNIVSEIYSRMLIFKPGRYARNQAVTEEPKECNVQRVSLAKTPNNTVNSPKIDTKSIESDPKASFVRESNSCEQGIASILTQDRDSIDRLSELVDNILVSGGEKSDLIRSVYGALIAVYETKFSSPIDDLRMKCIIKKLDYAV